MDIFKLHQLFLDSTGVSTDTRSLKINNLFFALSGNQFNGNKFAKQALDKGATKAIIDDKDFESENTILVNNCLEALQALANYHRNYLKIDIIAITGSNGKTTTKELTTAVLQKKYRVVATKGNLNNHIGVPLTLLSMTKETEIGIVEMGANHQGEIRALCEIAEPNVGYITNFGKAHLEGFGGIEGVIKGKSELYNYLISNQGIIFINTEDKIQVEKCNSYQNTISFGEMKEANYAISNHSHNHSASISHDNKNIYSQLTGKYNSANMAAATAIGLYFKVELNSIKEAIESYVPSNNRSQIIKTNHNTIILDAYNANPTSMALAIENLDTQSSKQKTIILGDMFEVGPTSDEEHQQIVELLENLDFHLAIVCGENFYKTHTDKVISFKEFSEMKLYVSKQSLKNNTILIKGSRGMQLERLLELWT